MTIRDLLNNGSGFLENFSESPRLDCSIILAYIMDIDRAKLLASYPDSVTEEVLNRYQELLGLRKAGHPISYILKEKEFYGYRFYVENGVLTPRPDTEILVETALDIIERHQLKSVMDICTGTGCIAITLKKERPELDITATDISPIAERVFTINNNNLLDSSVKFIHSNLFENLSGQLADIIVTNPPYLTIEETSQRMSDGWQEPALALDGGVDGLDLIRTIIKEAPKHLNPKGWLIIEADPSQMEQMKSLMLAYNFKHIKILEDLASLDRIIVGQHE